MQCPTRAPCLLRHRRVPEQGHHQRGPSPLLFLLRLQKDQVRELVAKLPARSSARAPCFLRHHQKGRNLLLHRRHYHRRRAPEQDHCHRPRYRLRKVLEQVHHRLHHQTGLPLRLLRH